MQPGRTWSMREIPKPGKDSGTRMAKRFAAREHAAPEDRE